MASMKNVDFRYYTYLILCLSWLLSPKYLQTKWSKSWVKLYHKHTMLTIVAIIFTFIGERVKSTYEYFAHAI
jgi:hypothetical protein